LNRLLALQISDVEDRLLVGKLFLIEGDEFVVPGNLDLDAAPFDVFQCLRLPNTSLPLFDCLLVEIETIELPLVLVVDRLLFFSRQPEPLLRGLLLLLPQRFDDGDLLFEIPLGLALPTSLGPARRDGFVQRIVLGDDGIDVLALRLQLRGEEICLGRLQTLCAALACYKQVSAYDICANVTAV